MSSQPLHLLLLLLILACLASPFLSDATSSPAQTDTSAPPPPPVVTEQDLFASIHALENQLRAQRQALSALQDARARSDRAAAAAASAVGQPAKDSEQACAIEEGDGQQGECASPDEQLKLVGSRVLGYRVKAAAWLPWAVSHASIYVCVAGDDGALHVYSRTGLFKASYPLPSCDPTSIDVSGSKTDVVAFIAVGCADASFVIISISGPPSRSQPRFSAGTQAAFAAADVSRLPPDTWAPTLSVISHTPPLSSSNPPPPPLYIPDDFYPAPPPSPPDTIKQIVAVHRQRIPSFLYVTAGGRIMVASRNGTLVAGGRVPDSHLPIASALYLSHSFVLLATQQGPVIWDFRVMSIVSSCTETVLEDVPVALEKNIDSDLRQETRQVRRPFTRSLITVTQEATAADSRYVHALDSRSFVLTFSVKIERSRVKCHLLNEIPGALPSPPPLPSLTGLRGGFAATCANHVNIFRTIGEGTGAALEIQMPIRSSQASSSGSRSPAHASHLSVGDGAYVLATFAADGTLTMYQVCVDLFRVFLYAFSNLMSVTELLAPPPFRQRCCHWFLCMDLGFFHCATAPLHAAFL